VTNKEKILKVTFKTFKINIGLLIISNKIFKVTFKTFKINIGLLIISNKILKVTFKTFKINIGLLIIRSNHKSKREKVSFPSFLSWSPSIAHTLSH
jgi:hypothetical protein